MILYLVRHGETESNRLGLALGRADVPLNQRGFWQAARLAAALARERLAAVYSSPLKRTVQTAEAIAEPHAIQVQPAPGLVEMDIGEAEGLTFAEVRGRFPGLLEAWVSVDGPQQAMPGGERLLEVQHRAWDTLKSLSRVHQDETVCAVTHNFVILSVLTVVLRMELADFRRLRHGVAAISVLDMQRDRVRLRGLNDICHLD